MRECVFIWTHFYIKEESPGDTLLTASRVAAPVRLQVRMQIWLVGVTLGGHASSRYMGIG